MVESTLLGKTEVIHIVLILRIALIGRKLHGDQQNKSNESFVLQPLETTQLAHITEVLYSVATGHTVFLYCSSLLPYLCHAHLYFFSLWQHLIRQTFDRSKKL